MKPIFFWCFEYKETMPRAQKSKFQSKLKEKLRKGTVQKVKVSRESLPRPSDQTVVPDITFSDIVREKSIAETTSARSTRSSRKSQGKDVTADGTECSSPGKKRTRSTPVLSESRKLRRKDSPPRPPDEALKQNSNGQVSSSSQSQSTPEEEQLSADIEETLKPESHYTEEVESNSEKTTSQTEPENGLPASVGASRRSSRVSARKLADEAIDKQATRENDANGTTTKATRRRSIKRNSKRKVVPKTSTKTDEKPTEQMTEELIEQADDRELEENTALHFEVEVHEGHVANTDNQSAYETVSRAVDELVETLQRGQSIEDDDIGKSSEDDYVGRNSEDDRLGRSSGDDNVGGKSSGDDYIGKSSEDDRAGTSSKNENLLRNSEDDDFERMFINGLQHNAFEIEERDTNSEIDNRETHSEHGNRETNSENDNRDSNSEHENRETNSENDNRDSNSEHDNRETNSEHDNRDSNSEQDNRDSNSEHDNRESNTEHENRETNFGSDHRGTNFENVIPEKTSAIDNVVSNGEIPEPIQSTAAEQQQQLQQQNQTYIPSQSFDFVHQNELHGEAEVSAETREIRERIRRRLESSNDDDSDDDSDLGRRHIRNTDRLFDTLIADSRSPKSDLQSLNDIDVTDFSGQIPSELLAPGIVENVDPNLPDNVTYDAEPNRSSDDSKRRRPHPTLPAKVAACVTGEEVNPSFSSDEDVTNNSLNDGVSRVLQTLCVSQEPIDDSDADLDLIMSQNIKKEPLPKLLDVATSMSRPDEEPESADSLALEIDTNESRFSDDSSDFEGDSPLPTEYASIQAVDIVVDSCLQEGDRGEIVPFARRSKMQSTVLNANESKGVGTGPSLMQPEILEVEELIPSKIELPDSPPALVADHSVGNEVVGVADVQAIEPAEPREDTSSDEDDAQPFDALRIEEEPASPRRSASPRASVQNTRSVVFIEQREECLTSDKDDLVDMINDEDYEEIINIDFSQGHANSIGNVTPTAGSSNDPDGAPKRFLTTARIETPRSASTNAKYCLGGRIHVIQNDEEEFYQTRNQRTQGRSKRRSLFQEDDEVPTDILPPRDFLPIRPMSMRTQSSEFRIDVSKLPNMEASYIEMSFDTRDLADQLLSSANKSLMELGRDREEKLEIKEVLNEILDDSRTEILQLMEELAKKHILKKRIEKIKETDQFRRNIAAQRKRIVDNVAKIVPEGLSVHKYFGFDPRSEAAPPMPVREVNKKRAIEEEARFIQTYGSWD